MKLRSSSQNKVTRQLPQINLNLSSDKQTENGNMLIWEPLQYIKMQIMLCYITRDDNNVHVLGKG